MALGWAHDAAASRRVPYPRESQADTPEREVDGISRVQRESVRSNMSRAGAKRSASQHHSAFGGTNNGSMHASRATTGSPAWARPETAPAFMAGGVEEASTAVAEAAMQAAAGDNVMKTLLPFLRF